MESEIISAIIGLIGGIIGGLLSIKGTSIGIKLKNKYDKQHETKTLLRSKNITNGISKVISYLKDCNYLTRDGSSHSDYIKYSEMTYPINEAIQLNILLNFDYESKISSINEMIMKLIQSNEDKSKANEKIRSLLIELDFYFNKLIVNPLPNWYFVLFWKIQFNIKKMLITCL